MSGNPRLRALIAALLALVLVLGVAACGDDDDDDGDGGGGAAQIQSNPDNGNVSLTIGSKNFTEQIVLGEIYAQALEAAGYQITADLNLGDENIALAALKADEISGYPEYTSTALSSFFDVKPEDIPADAQQAYEEANADFQKDGLTAFPPAPFSSSNGVGTLKKTADELGLTTVSDLEGKSQDLTLYGSPECRQRFDCLLGLQDVYGLQFKDFKPVAIELRYEVLDKGQADLSILFTTDAQLAEQADKYVILEDPERVFPAGAGNPIFVTKESTVEEAGPDLEKTITAVQSGLTLPVIQELNARVDIDRQQPSQVATDYLKESGFIE
jgi:glycine betaine/choline ABC-type transport system substrate-binding protein